MSARSVGTLLRGYTPRPRGTYVEVHRHSYHRGEREHLHWRQIGKTKSEARRVIGARMAAAEAYDRERKRPGAPNGPLGLIGLQLLRECYRIVDFKTGCLEPCLDTLARRCRRSRVTIVAALKRLKQHGFLDWIRRTEPLDNDGAGPQVRQISNAYFFGLPAAAADFVTRILGAAPVPADAAQRHLDDAVATDAMVASQPLDEQARFYAGDGDLGDTLAALGRALGKSASSADELNPSSKR